MNHTKFNYAVLLSCWKDLSIYQLVVMTLQARTFLVQAAISVLIISQCKGRMNILIFA